MIKNTNSSFLMLSFIFFNIVENWVGCIFLNKIVFLLLKLIHVLYKIFTHFDVNFRTF